MTVMTYEARGAGSEPILCLHGVGGNAASFQPQLEGLSDAFRVIALNLPGYGGSAPLAEPSFEGLAAALLALMDGLEVRRAHLCGQSIGGMIALETAVRAPDRVASLALIATTPAFGGRDDSFKDQFVAARLAPLDAGKTLLDLAAAFVPEITGPGATADVLAAATASMAAVPEATYRGIIRCLTTFDRRTEIAGIDLPACLIAGGHDQNAPPKTMARMAEKMPRADYHLIEGAGHLVNLEAADETNDILRAFYGRLI